MTDEGIPLAVLGSLLSGLGPPATLEGADFVKPSHRAIYRAIMALRADAVPPDAVLAHDWLKRHGEAEGLYVHDLGLAAGAGVASPKTLDAYVRRLKAERRGRDLRAGALAVLEASPLSAPEDMQEAVARINAAASAPAATRAPSHVSHGLDRLFTQGRQPAAPLGIEALRDLDINPGHLVVIGARPGVGKTALLGTCALAAAREGWDVLFLSLEMPCLEIQQRLLSGLSGIPLGEVKRAENPAMLDGVRALSVLSVWVEDGHEEPRIALDLEGIGALVRLFAATVEGHPKLVLVDYLQFVRARARFERRHELVGHVCRELKRLAVDARVALVVAAQLSRQVEQRGKDAKPQMADLSESSDIEKNADKIVFIHRAEGEPVLLRVAKNRQGACWTVEAAYNGPLCQFTDAGGGWQ